jgi:hypothetical protein
VRDLASFVADERDLAWEHPVLVEFLPEEEFEGEVTADEADLTEEEAQELSFAAGWFRALGLAEGEIDLLAEQNTASAGGIAAFYDPYSDRIYVREPEGGAADATSAADLPPDLRATLAHELTHALQDQQVDLTRFDDPEADSTLAFTSRAVVEGDAQRVERAYVEGFAPSEMDEYTEATEGAYEGFVDETGEVPPAILLFQGAPYGLGLSFLDVVTAVDGAAEVDELLVDPPASEEQLLDPVRYLEGDQPVDVEPPSVPDGAEVVEEGVFGSMGWYLLLAAQIDPLDALEATDGWGGDAYVVYDDGERACFRMHYRGDAEADTDEMEAALGEWSDALPDDMAEVERTGGTITVETCDPGADTEIGVSDQLADLLSLPVTRSYVLAGLLQAEENVVLDRAECYAHEFVAQVTLDELASPDPWPDERIAELQQDALAACAE